MKSIPFFLTILIAVQYTHSQSAAKAEVTVTDFKEIPITGAEIFFIDTDQERTIRGISDYDGKFTVELEAGTYNIRLKHKEKTKDYTFIEIPTLKPNEDYGKVQIQILYQASSSFVLTDLLFDTNSDIIQPTSFTELDQLAEYLRQNRDVFIEIAGHTDSDGTDVDNLDLSTRRAEAVRKYLTSKGIATARLRHAGYGESQPISDNATSMGKALNRRTEIHFTDAQGNRLK